MAYASKALIFLTLGLPLMAQPGVTRNIDLSWSPSSSAGVIGYNIYRCAATTAACTPSVNTAPINGTTPVPGNSFVDTTPVVGNTYTYAATAIAAACTPTTPATTPCGSSDLSVPVTTTVPPKPAVIVVIQINVP